MKQCTPRAYSKIAAESEAQLAQSELDVVEAQVARLSNLSGYLGWRVDHAFIDSDQDKSSSMPREAPRCLLETANLQETLSTAEEVSRTILRGNG